MIVLAFDTETTGLIESHLLPLERQPYVIQFCGMLVDLASESVMDSFTTLVRPLRLDSLTEKITTITRISRNDLENTPTFAGVSDKIIGMIEAAPAVAAHNLSYDREVLDIEAKRIGMSIRWPDKLICSVEATEYLKGFRLNLSSLHQILLGVEFNDAHRADIDTEALVRCLVAMHKREII